MSGVLIAIIVVAIILLVITLTIIIARKKGKKKNGKLDEVLNKVKEEKAQLEQKEQLEKEKKQEEETFKNITISDDVEKENFDEFFNDSSFKEFQSNPFNSETIPEPKAEGFNGFDDFDDSFFDDFKPNAKKIKKVSRDDDFEQFLNEHSYSRRVLDKDLINEFKNLSPKLKAIVLGRVFDKFDD